MGTWDRIHEHFEEVWRLCSRVAHWMSIFTLISTKFVHKTPKRCHGGS